MSSISIVCHSTGTNSISLDDQSPSGQLTSEEDAMINLPSSLFGRLDNHSTVGLFYALYEDSTLFPVGERNTANTGLLETQVNSLVLAAIVGPGIAFDNLEENVTVTLHVLTTSTMVLYTHATITSQHSMLK